MNLHAAMKLPDTLEEARNKEVQIDGQKIVFKEKATLLPVKPDPIQKLQHAARF